MLRMLQICPKSVEDVTNVSESVESVSKLISVRKKSVFAETYKIRWSVVGFSFSSLGSSVGVSPSYEKTFFTFCNGDKNSLSSTRIMVTRTLYRQPEQND